MLTLKILSHHWLRWCLEQWCEIVHVIDTPRKLCCHFHSDIIPYHRVMLNPISIEFELWWKRHLWAPEQWFLFFSPSLSSRGGISGNGHKYLRKFDVLNHLCNSMFMVSILIDLGNDPLLVLFQAFHIDIFVQTFSNAFFKWKLLYPPLQRSWKGGILVSLRPSVCPIKE